MIEIRLAGSVINGLERDAIIQALEVGPGNGGKGAKAVTLDETASN